MLLGYTLLVIYRLTFHPLAKYLGNFIDKLSDWPLIYHCYSGNRRLRRLKAHKKYGMRKISRKLEEVTQHLAVP